MCVRLLKCVVVRGHHSKTLVLLLLLSQSTSMLYGTDLSRQCHANGMCMREAAKAVAGKAGMPLFVALDIKIISAYASILPQCTLCLL